MKSELVISAGRETGNTGVQIPYPWKVAHRTYYGDIHLVAHRALKPKWRDIVMESLHLEDKKVIERLFKKGEWVMAEKSTGYKAGPIFAEKANDIVPMYRQWLTTYCENLQREATPEGELRRVYEKALQRYRTWNMVDLVDVLRVLRDEKVETFTDAVIVLQEGGAE